jgi:uncharacterized ferritin-like protein (DUF455 family)
MVESRSVEFSPAAAPPVEPNMPLDQTLTRAACAMLKQADPRDKARRSRAVAADWRAGRITSLGDSPPPPRPARPAHPRLVAPRDVPKRRLNSKPEGRVALLHALAHIELNAIDLAWDIIARFAGMALPRAFFDDWVKVADDEASIICCWTIAWAT